MALFSKDGKQPLSTHQAEPIGGPILSPRLTPEVSGNQLQDRGGVRGDAPPLTDSAIDVDSRLKTLARQIAGSKKKLVGNVLEIGRALTDAQDLLADHAGGAFGKWVKQNCGFSKRTAYRYMSAHLTFGRCATVAQRRFEPSTMYLLANDSTPSAAVTEAIQLAESGETVTSKTAKKLITKHGDGKPVRKVSSRPDPILYDDPEAAVIVRPKHPGVDPSQVLARIFKKIMADRKASEAA